MKGVRGRLSDVTDISELDLTTLVTIGYLFQKEHFCVVQVVHQATLGRSSPMLEQVDQNRYREGGSTRFIYEQGLKTIYAACHDPLPSEMIKLLKRLKDLEGQQHDD